ncbi:hypothetical protein G9A89_003365 [Geosiphon pyriformis]|nr:hypothetical protein G9A89_003365 [Geosiphon pyriformis]
MENDNNDKKEEKTLDPERDRLYDQESLFLIARHLETIPECFKAFEELKRALETNAHLLPESVDYMGNKCPRKYAQMKAMHESFGGSASDLRRLLHKQGHGLPEHKENLIDHTTPNNISLKAKNGQSQIPKISVWSAEGQKDEKSKTIAPHPHTIVSNRSLLSALMPPSPPLPRRNICRTLDSGDPFRINIVKYLMGRELGEQVPYGPIGVRSLLRNFEEVKNILKNDCESKIFFDEQVAYIKTHTQDVYCLLFDTNGNRLFTASEDFLVRAWCAKTGALIATMTLHFGAVNDMAINRLNTLLATASDDCSCILWNLRTYLPVSQYFANDVMNSVSFSPSPIDELRCLIATSSDQITYIFQYDSKEDGYKETPICVLAENKVGTNKIHCHAFNSTGSLFAIGGSDGLVRIFSYIDGRYYKRDLEDPSVIYLKDDELQRACGSYKHKALYATLPQNETLCQDQENVPKLNKGKAKEILDISKKLSIKTNMGIRNSAVAYVEGSSFKTTPILNNPISQNRPLGSIRAPRNKQFLQEDWGEESNNSQDEDFEIYEANSSITGQEANQDSQIEIDEDEDDHLNGPVHLVDLEGHTARITVLAFSHLGNRLLSGAKDGTARVHDYVAKEKEWRSFSVYVGNETEQDNASAVAWSMDDRMVIIGSNHGLIFLANSVTGEVLHTLIGHSDTVYVVEPHPRDNRTLMTAGHDGRIIFWDILDGTKMKEWYYPDFPGIDNETGVHEMIRHKFFEGKFTSDALTFAVSCIGGFVRIFSLGDASSWDTVFERFEGGQKFVYDDLTPSYEMDSITKTPLYWKSRGEVMDFLDVPYEHQLSPLYGLDIPSLNSRLVAREEQQLRSQLRDDLRSFAKKGFKRHVLTKKSIYKRRSKFPRVRSDDEEEEDPMTIEDPIIPLPLDHDPEYLPGESSSPSGEEDSEISDLDPSIYEVSGPPPLYSDAKDFDLDGPARTRSGRTYATQASEREPGAPKRKRDDASPSSQELDDASFSEEFEELQIKRPVRARRTTRKINYRESSDFDFESDDSRESKQRRSKRNGGPSTKSRRSSKKSK